MTIEIQLTYIIRSKLYFFSEILIYLSQKLFENLSI